MNILWIHYGSITCSADSLRIHHLFRESTMNWLFISRINNEFTFCFFEMQCFSYLFHEFTRKTHGIWQINYQFTIYFAKSVWLYHLYQEFTINPWKHYESFAFQRIHYEFTIFFANQLSIYCFRENTMNSLPFRRIHCESILCFVNHNGFTIFFVKSLWIHHLYREITIN